MFDHTLRLTYNRNPMTATLDEHVSTSRLEVEADSTDLTQAWRELLSRLPSDVYAALRLAVESLECGVCGDRDDVAFCQVCMRGYASKWQALEQQVPPGGAPVQFE